MAIKLLTAACLVEAIVIVELVGTRPAPDTATVRPELPAVASAAQSGPERAALATPKADPTAPARPDLAQVNTALETELAAVKQELETRKSEISFSYGTVRDSGRFVGMTFRKMFETAAARETAEAQARLADNQLNVLSLGPFIQDAEVIESDPAAFAQFQGALISQVLGLTPERGAEVEAVLADLKTKSLRLETGSPEWTALNDSALQRITGMLGDSEKAALKGQLDFFQQYGVLVIPAYAILRSPTPTVVNGTGTATPDANAK